MDYVLITPARNEERFLEGTLESVIAQTKRPIRWAIVDDGSTDRTAEIVERYVRDHSWIELVRRPGRLERSFAGKVHAFNAGLAQVQQLQAELIGNLDADVVLAPDHFEFLLARFSEDPALGVAGTAYTQQQWDSTRDSFEGETSVHGACQLFRARCFQEIGGYVPNPAGGVDWIAVTTARMKGWKTRNFPDKRFQHLRIMGTAERSSVGAMFDYGAKDYFLGGSPVWQIFRVAYRIGKKPVLFGGLALLFGYCWAAVRRVERPVTPELMRFHRQEQMRKLKAILSSALRLKVEKFYLETNQNKPGHS
jgi:glycosyltransferase involved in cell wall biosynthesis